jgi:F-box interacting protein
MSDFLPLNVVNGMLQELPFKSVIRFRSVSKAWNSLITSPAFINSHDPLPPPEPLLMVSNIFPNLEQFTLFNDDETFGIFMELEFPLTNPISHFRCIGSDHGLICLSGDGGFFLWNPLIGKVVTLPEPSSSKFKGRTNHAFVFDPESKDYLLVRICVSSRKNACSSSRKHAKGKKSTKTNTTMIVEIYSVKRGSWEKFEMTAFGESIVIADNGQRKTLLNGWVHFAAKKGRMGCVLEFGVHEKVFKIIELPESCVWSHSFNKIVTIDYMGSLAIVHFPDNPLYCSIWVRKEENLWENTIRIAIASGFLWNVLSFRKNGHIIIETSRDMVGFPELCSYDPESKEVTRLGIRGEFNKFCVDTYMVSLALLNANDNEATDGKVSLALLNINDNEATDEVPIPEAEE